MAPLWLHGISARLMPCQKAKIKYFDYVRFRTVLFLTFNFYISRGKASNIDVDDSSSNIGESINNGDTIGDDNDQSESEASGTWSTLISVWNNKSVWLLSFDQ